MESKRRQMPHNRAAVKGNTPRKRDLQGSGQDPLSIFKIAQGDLKYLRPWLLAVDSFGLFCSLTPTQSPEDFVTYP